MKPSDHHHLFSYLRPSRKLSHVALFGCLLITLLLVCLMKSSSNTMVTLNMQLSSYENVSLPMVRESGVVQQDEDLTTKEISTVMDEQKTKESAWSLQLQFDQHEDGDDSNTTSDSILSNSPPDSNEKEEEEPTDEDLTTKETSTIMEEQKTKESAWGLQLQFDQNEDASDSILSNLPPDSNEREEEEPTESNGEIPRKESRVMCDFTAPRSDTCQIDGDVRVVAKSSTILLASPLTGPSQNTTWKLRPYPRKWEHATMEPIKELTISLAAAAAAADDYQRRPPPPRCTVTHAVPAAFFSTGGFVGNYFHDFTDVIIPLFMTVRRFQGQVRFLVSDFNYPFMAKYRPILERLSNYPPINLDASDGEVHCFPQAHVGLFSHRALGIDSVKSPDGISMRDFRDFLRSCFSLKRRISRGISRGKPRLLLILRRGSRSFVNEREVTRMVKSVGFKLITAGPEETRNMSRFAQLVNSVDVLMGIHGAGLTNMVFLPANATVVQIIPCCQLADGCRYIFAEPAPAMGLKYADYEIKVEESTLSAKYPRDHVVFRDPISIQKMQGFNAFWNIFLNHQKGELMLPRRPRGRKLDLSGSSLDMRRTERMKMMDMEMKALDGFLLFFVMFWQWSTAGLGLRRLLIFW